MLKEIKKFMKSLLSCAIILTILMIMMNEAIKKWVPDRSMTVAEYSSTIK